MGSGRLFHKEGPVYDKVLQGNPLIVLQGNPCKTISCVYSTMQSKFKDFIQVKRTAVVNKFENYCMYALVNFFISR